MTALPPAGALRHPGPPLPAPANAVDDLDLLQAWFDLSQARLIELGCGAAPLARKLLEAHPGCRIVGLEVDERQHAKNLERPHPRLQFEMAGAQAIPFGDGAFDLGLMLKSLHHVPLTLLDVALGEAHRVLRPGGHLYVSEPVYAGALNEMIRLFNDEGEVRAAAQAALDRALASGRWMQAGEARFETPVRYADFAEFERRMVNVTFAERRIDPSVRGRLQALFESHQGPDGVRLVRPMHVRLLQAA